MKITITKEKTEIINRRGRKVGEDALGAVKRPSTAQKIELSTQYSMPIRWRDKSNRFWGQTKKARAGKKGFREKHRKLVKTLTKSLRQITIAQKNKKNYFETLIDKQRRKGKETEYGGGSTAFIGCRVQGEKVKKKSGKRSSRRRLNRSGIN